MLFGHNYASFKEIINIFIFKQTGQNCLKKAGNLLALPSGCCFQNTHLKGFKLTRVIEEGLLSLIVSGNTR